MAKQSNELLIKNHESYPTSFISFLEVNSTSFNYGHGHDHG